MDAMTIVVIVIMAIFVVGGIYLNFVAGKNSENTTDNTKKTNKK